MLNERWEGAREGVGCCSAGTYERAPAVRGGMPARSRRAPSDAVFGIS
jgi:hypothetical protein